MCGVVTPKDNVKIDKAPLQIWYLKKKIITKQTGVICEVVTPQRQDQVWSSPLAMFLLKLGTAGLLKLKIE